MLRYGFYGDLASYRRQWRHGPPYGLLCFHANEDDVSLLQRHVQPLRSTRTGRFPVVLEWQPRTDSKTPYPFTHFSLRQMTLEIAGRLIDFVRRRGFGGADFVLQQDRFYHSSAETLKLIDFLWIVEQLACHVVGCEFRIVFVKGVPGNSLEGFLSYAPRRGAAPRCPITTRLDS